MGGFTTFERILPGPDRMYPDTDCPPRRITEERVAAIEIGQRAKALKRAGIPVERLRAAEWISVFDLVLVASTSAPRDVGAISHEGVETEHMRMLFVPLAGAPAPAIPLRDPWFSLPRPDVSVLPDGTTLVLYSGWRHDVGVTRRVAMQMLAPPAQPRRRTAAR